MALQPRLRIPLPEEAPDNSPIAIDILAAGLRRQNPVSQVVERGIKPDFEPVPGYNAYADDGATTKRYDTDRFITSRSPDETAWIAGRFDSEMEDRDVLDRAGGLAQFGAETLGIMTSPGIWATTIAAAPLLTTKAAVTAARTAATATTGTVELGLVAKNLARRRALGIAAEGPASEAVNELALQALQETRTKTESAINIGAATVISGAFGLLSRQMSKAEFTRSQEALKTALKPPDPVDPTRSMGAAERKTGDLAPAGNRFGHWLRRLTGGLGQAYVDSTSPTFRRFALQMGLQIRTKAHEAGDAVIDGPTVQAQLLDSEADLAARTKMLNGAYAEYRLAGGRMDRVEFVNEISDAVREGRLEDVHPSIRNAAESLREEMAVRFDESVELTEGPLHDLWRAEQELRGDTKLRPSDAVGIDAYWPRIYDQAALVDPVKRGAFVDLLTRRIAEVINRPDEFTLIRTGTREAVGNGLYQEIKDVFETVPTQQINHYMNVYPDARVIEAGKRTAEAIDKEARGAAESILSNISGAPAMLDAEYLAPTPAALQRRSLRIVSDAELSTLGVLERDAEKIVEHRNQQQIRNLAMQRSFGGKRLKDIEDAIKRDYQAARQANPTKVKALNKRERQDLRWVETMRQRALGIAGRPDNPEAVLVQAGRGIRAYNATTLLMGAGLNVALDMVAPALRVGIRPVARAYLDLVTGLASRKGYKQFAQSIGLATEMVAGGRVLSMAEATDMTGILARFTQGVGKASGMSFFTDVAETAATLIAARSLKTRLGRMTAKDTANLAEVGINAGDAKALKLFLDDYFDARTGRFADGADPRMVAMIHNAVRTEVRQSIIKPGITDLPRVMDSEAGKFFFQFMSFPITATQRWTAAGLSRGDAEFLSGFLALTAAGALVEGTKATLLGRDIDSAGDLLVGSIDRSGTLGLAGTFLSAGYAVASGSGSSRYILRDPISIYTGPGVGPVSQLATRTIPGVFKDGDLDDWHRFVRAIPYINAIHSVDALRLLYEGAGYREKK